MEKPTILIVDDDPVSLALLSKLVAKQDYNVIQATNGERALELLHEEAVDCVVADYDMPLMSGLDLLKKVKAEFPRLPFVMVTAYSNLRVIRDAWYAGAFDFFQKPVFVDRLNQTLRLAVEFGHLTLARRKFPRLEMQRDPDLLDTGVVRELAVALDREDLKAIVEEFETHVRCDLEHVLLYNLAKKFDETRRLAHRMAGTAVNLGLVKFSEEMRDIELNPSCKIEGNDKLHETLEKSLHWLHSALDEIFQELAS